MLEEEEESLPKTLLDKLPFIIMKILMKDSNPKTIEKKL